MGPIGRRRVTQQVLRDPHREPEGEDPLAPRAARGPGQDAQQRRRRRIPPAHASVRVQGA